MTSHLWFNLHDILTYCISVTGELEKYI